MDDRDPNPRPFGALHYNGRVFALRYAYVLALVVWIGGMAVLAAVSAPATFEVLQQRDPANGRALAGAVFGESLRRFHHISYAAAAVLLLSLAVMAVVGPRPRGFWIRLAIIAMMAAIALYSGFVLTTRITGLQSQVQGPIQNLPATDPRRAEFGRLHGLANVLMLVNMAGGLALLIWEARD